MKGIDFDQSSSPVLAAPTLWIIVAIDSTYHITIGIAYFINAFQKNLKYYYERGIIDFPPHQLSCSIRRKVLVVMTVFNNIIS